MTSHPSYLLRTSIPPSAIIGIAVVVLMAGDTVVLASEPVAAGTDDKNQNPPRAALFLFKSKIRPVLVRECYSCHSAETQKGPKANLRVDTREGLIQGGTPEPQ